MKDDPILEILFAYPLPIMRALVEKGIWISEDGTEIIRSNVKNESTPEQNKMMLTLIKMAEEKQGSAF